MVLYNQNMKIAIVHDYLNQRGGAERVVDAISNIFPDAPIYTSIYFPDDTFPGFKNKDIRTSFMQNFPFIRRHFKKYFFIYPFAFKRFNFDEYDVVISSSSAYASGIDTGPNTLHICYCHTPARFLYMYDEYVKREKYDLLVKFLLPYFIARLKKWDIDNSINVNYFIANSSAVSERIKKYYGRKSDVIYPPIETQKYKQSDSAGNYFLVVSRLATYKRLDLAIKAFTRLKFPLKVVGTGPDLADLKKMSSSNIEFLSAVSDNSLLELYRDAKALVFPGLEDFGITPLEAQASGIPVIAYGEGGALETVVDGKTGVFFHEQTPEALVEAVNKFNSVRFDKKFIKSHADIFDFEIFKNKLLRFINKKYEEFIKK